MNDQDHVPTPDGYKGSGTSPTDVAEDVAAPEGEVTSSETVSVPLPPESSQTSQTPDTKGYIYHYRDEQGVLLYDVLRKPNKKFFARRPDPNNPEKFINNLNGVRRVLYRLPQIVSAPPDATVFVVEGEKDADTLASLDLLATTNSGGPGQWKDECSESLKGRAVVIIPDNDDDGHDHAQRVARNLHNVANSVRILELPGQGPGEDVTDWVGRGGTVEKLLVLAAAAPLYQPSGIPYFEQGGETMRVRQTKDGPVVVPIANFTARITLETITSDGVEETRTFEGEARVAGQVRSFKVPAAQFRALNWVAEQLGAGAVVYPHQKEYMTTAIPLLSSNMQVRRLYSHTGWMEKEGHHYYLHADGAIGPVGPVGPAPDTPPPISSGEMLLPEPLKKYRLPNPPTGERLSEALQASLGLLELGPSKVMVPVLAGIYAPIVSDLDFSLFLSGPTGAGKSEIAAQAQQHYGAKMDSRHLPAGWNSTPNAIELLAFCAKDALMVVDDFIPTGPASEVAKKHGEADRVLRGAGNREGRQRMDVESGLRRTYYPRCLMACTGEDVPAGHSLRARMLNIEVGSSDINFDKLTISQQNAAKGEYAEALAGFVQWVATDYEGVRAGVGQRSVKLRSQFEGKHRRTALTLAALATALEALLKFAVEAGAISDSRQQEIWETSLAAFKALAEGQDEEQLTHDCTEQFLNLLRAAIASGKAHVADAYGNAPRNADAWGWKESAYFGAEDNICRQAKGQRVGWLDGQDLYLEPEVSYKAAKDMGGNGPDALSVTKGVLRRRLKDKGLLASTDEKRKKLPVRRILEGSRKYVLHLKANTLVEVAPSPQSAQQGQSDRSGEDESEEA
jgi:hypothetical protein